MNFNLQRNQTVTNDELKREISELREGFLQAYIESLLLRVSLAQLTVLLDRQYPSLLDNFINTFNPEKKFADLMEFPPTEKFGPEIRETPVGEISNASFCRLPDTLSKYRNVR